MQDTVRAIAEGTCGSRNYEIGYADLRGLLGDEFRHCQFAVSIVRKLDDGVIDAVSQGPTQEYFDLYQSVNNELNDRARAISERLVAVDVRAVPVRATVHDGELDDRFKSNLRYKFSHKMAATCAGLGWIGKTDLFISKKYGPRVRLATVLTDVPLVPSHPPVEESLCGACSACVDACPAGAANGGLWNTGSDSDDFYDAFKCMRYCKTISRSNLHREVSLCGICVSVCPRGGG
jgi:epoxyqueuosine reductase